MNKPRCVICKKEIGQFFVSGFLGYLCCSCYDRWLIRKLGTKSFNGDKK